MSAFSLLACQQQPPPLPHQSTVDHSGFGVPDEEKEIKSTKGQWLHPRSPIKYQLKWKGLKLKALIEVEGERQKWDRY